jgi:hypothetical protein
MCLLGGLSKIEDRINNEFNKGKKKTQARRACGSWSWWSLTTVFSLSMLELTARN